MGINDLIESRLTIAVVDDGRFKVLLGLLNIFRIRQIARNVTIDPRCSRDHRNAEQYHRQTTTRKGSRGQPYEYTQRRDTFS